MTIQPKQRPKPFYLPANNSERRKQQGNSLVRYLQSLPNDKHFKIVVSEGKEKRSEEQNALWWCWNQELSRAHDESYTSDEFHGINKLEVLLPLMCHEWERWREEGNFIRAAMANVSSYPKMIELAYKFVESSTLHVSEGKLYTERLQEHWRGRGIVLEVQASAKRYSDYREAG